MDINLITGIWILIMGVFTYMILPAIFILRDIVIWKIIDVFILNNKLRNQIIEYVKTIAIRKGIKGIELIHKNGKTEFTINGEKSTREKCIEYRKNSEEESKRVSLTEQQIKRKALLFDRILSNYKQETTNTFNKWIEDARESIKEENRRKLL